MEEKREMTTLAHPYPRQRCYRHHHKNCSCSTEATSRTTYLKIDLA